MGFISVIIFFTNDRALEKVSGEIQKSFIFTVYFSIFALSIFLMMSHAFIKRKKYKFEKKLMLKCAVLMNFVSGMLASASAIENSIGLWGIFPAINIVNSFVLVTLAKFEIINEANISDENANFYEVLISAILAVIVFVVSTYYFEHTWFITFSMCVAYATNFNTQILILIENSLKIDLGITSRCAMRRHTNGRKISI